MSTQTQCRRIAAYLRGCAARLQYEDPGRTISYGVPQTGLVVSCQATREAVLAVAAKFEKGPWHKPQGYGPRRNRKPPAPVIDTVLSFMDDDEWDNAREYLRQWPRDKWPRVAVERLTAWEEQA